MTSHQVQLLFIDLGLILFLARTLGYLATRVNQPAVVGEIVAGVLLGPSLFNGAVPDLLFPADIRPLLAGMADVGVALFMFAIGLELERATLRGRSRVTGGAIVGSTVAPFLLGIGLAFYLLRTHEPENRAGFVVFIGLVISVTAFPVLARILSERGLSKSAIGGIALATAASVDVVAWTALAAVQATMDGSDEHWRVALAIPYVLITAFVVRPVLRAVFVRKGRAVALGPWHLPMLFTGVLLSGAATEAMGMHFIFGAFLFGTVMPREKTAALRAEIHERTGQVTSLLLPVYFVVAGLGVDLGSMNAGRFAELALILVVAVVGKIGGTYLGARSQGLPARPAVSLGVLMNTRGLTELVILGVGLQIGLLDTEMYSLMVVMAVVTTAMTGPLLARIHRKPLDLAREPEPVGPGPTTVSKT
ncbi:cation:proton antiporter [Streptomyces iconiensis]|uniref:Cation:proton antiporter n=1 Tax=Streptomyces iconiensis TaxID=1384038 RepID=A0ABT6ZX78_9ACTN|nr:cation:proton antiporter [Streptomyces iconiensis]MDJ1133670.1 cation:proton antiporter [Streptomyces iconiensis]